MVWLWTGNIIFVSDASCWPIHDPLNVVDNFQWWEVDKETEFPVHVYMTRHVDC